MVMLIEIPDPDVIYGMLVAFLVGLFAFYAYYKIRPYIALKKVEADPGQLERLEYYERQLIDMKIRLDALDLEGLSVRAEQEEAGVEKERPRARDRPAMAAEAMAEEPFQARIRHVAAPSDIVDHVLQLITDKPMTSRDIQITLGRSREHTSRLMKKLFEEEYVHRDSTTKPYTYSITDKGREKINVLKVAQTQG